jgi:thiol:disulfide interchange protein DsbD
MRAVRPGVMLAAVALAAALAVVAVAEPPSQPAPSPQPAAKAPAGQAEWVARLSEKGLLWGLAVAFGTGILVSFTPCVYPMIPITLGIIGGRDENVSWRRGLALSCLYVLGLSVVYAALGVVAGVFGAAVRSLLMSPYVLVGVAVVFALLGLSMLGLFDLQIPSGLATKLQSVGGKGVVGVVLMGMVSGIVASPCVAAPLAGILAFVAVTGDALKGFLLLFTFAWGMGLLLIVVGTSAGALKSLPRSGEWMVEVKHLFGFLLIAVALYFVRTLVPELVYHLGLALCVIAAGIAFGALDSLPTSPGPGLRAKRGIALLILVIGFYVLVGTLWSRNVLLPARPKAEQTAATGAGPAGRIEWQTDIRQAFAQARSEHKRIFADFGAEWCAACKEMEEESFPRKEVVAAASGYVPLRVDVTDLSEEEDELQRKWDVVGYPTLVVAEADGTLVRSVAGLQTPEVLVAFLQEGPTPATETGPSAPTPEPPR